MGERMAWDSNASGAPHPLASRGWAFFAHFTRSSAENGAKNGYEQPRDRDIGTIGGSPLTTSEVVPCHKRFEE